MNVVGAVVQRVLRGVQCELAGELVLRVSSCGGERRKRTNMFDRIVLRLVPETLVRCQKLPFFTP